LSQSLAKKVDRAPSNFNRGVRVIVRYVFRLLSEKIPPDSLQVSDIEKWKSVHGQIPPGSVVMVEGMAESAARDT